VLFWLFFGVFLPWYTVRYAGEIFGVVLDEGLVFGHTLPFGQILLFLAALFGVLVLVPQKESYRSRLFVAQAFIAPLIVVLFVTNVFLYPLSSVVGLNPHVGILSILVGSVVLIYGIIKEYAHF
jgi:hypothetical protein